jgi:hypothetical protein
VKIGILEDTSPMLLIFSDPLEELQSEAIQFTEMSYNFQFKINSLGENIDTFANTPSSICLRRISLSSDMEFHVVCSVPTLKTKCIALKRRYMSSILYGVTYFSDVREKVDVRIDGCQGWRKCVTV